MAKEKTAPKEKGKDDLVLLFVGYIFWIVALIVYLLKKDELSKFSKYHYVQAIFMWLIAIVVAIFTLGFGTIFVWLYSIYLGYQVYTGKDPRPLEKYISKYAE